MPLTSLFINRATKVIQEFTVKILNTKRKLSTSENKRFIEIVFSSRTTLFRLKYRHEI